MQPGKKEKEPPGCRSYYVIVPYLHFYTKFYISHNTQMTNQEAIALIGLDRAKSVKSKGKKLLESEPVVFDQVSGFGIDSVYFNTDENGNSFPAIFLKKVNSFEKIPTGTRL